MKRQKIKIAIIIIAIISIVVGSSFTLAKYTGLLTNGFINTSSNFYFNSSFIKKNPAITLFGGENHTLTLDVENYLDDLRINSEDITYSVLITCNNSFNDYSITKNDIATSGGTLLGGAKSTDNLQISIDSGYINNTILTLTISSTSPYQKSMQTTITLKANQGAKYRVVDSANSNFAEMIIYTQTNFTIGSPLIIAFDNSELLIDTNNNYVISSTKSVDANNVINQISLSSISANSSFSIVFFKVDPSLNYSESESSIVSNTINLLDLVA